MSGREDSEPEPGAPSGRSPDLRELVERLEKACQQIEILQERTNTLVRLLDLMGRRVDQLEHRS